MNKVGLVCMARDRENSNKSQFFITLRDEDYDNLEGSHTIFGEVAEGFDVLQKLNALYCDENGRPFQDVRIRHTYLLDDPIPDATNLIVPPESPPHTIPPEETVKRRIPYEESLEAGADGRSEAEIEASIRRKEAQSRAIVLEMTGDIPDAEVKPPEEVLFVCKLNAITTDADLELIFSRFGTIKQCEIIRDFKTGDSLNYAFIEFETEDACIQAYEKMNNVLIDDRRIKVDFSQSVSKLWNRFLQRPRGVSKSPKAFSSSIAASGGDGGGGSGVAYAAAGARPSQQQKHVVGAPSSSRPGLGGPGHHSGRGDRVKDKDTHRGNVFSGEKGRDDRERGGSYHHRGESSSRTRSRSRSRSGNRDHNDRAQRRGEREGEGTRRDKERDYDHRGRKRSGSRDRERRR